MSRQSATRYAWIAGAFVSLMLAPSPSQSQPQEGSIFTVYFDSNVKNSLGLSAAQLKLNGHASNGDVPANSTLNLSKGPDIPKVTYWDYKQYVSIALAWTQTGSWKNFTTLDLSNAHMSSHSLGANLPPPPNPDGPTIKDLFAAPNFQVTTLIMDGLRFDEDDPKKTDSKKTFAQALADALSGSKTLTTVSLLRTSPRLDKPQIKSMLRARCPHITFKFP